MQAYNFNNFGGDLTNWMNQRFLDPILNLEGGWEYWLQIDFPAWLDVSTNRQFDFRREVAVGNVRLDWLVNSSQQPAVQPTAVEIKAQTHKYLNAKFKTDVAADVASLQGLGAGYSKLMLIAVVDPTLLAFFTGQGYQTLVNHHNVVALLAKTI